MMKPVSSVLAAMPTMPSSVHQAKKSLQFEDVLRRAMADSSMALKGSTSFALEVPD